MIDHPLKKFSLFKEILHIIQYLVHLFYELTIWELL